MSQLTLQQIFDLAFQQHRAGQLQEAERLYRQLLDLKPDFPEAHYNLGIALKQKGQLDEAIAAFRQAVVLRPNYAEAYNNLGNALRDKKQIDEAIAAFAKAMFLRPDSAEVHNNLGNALKEKGQLDEAIAAYRRAITLRPGYAEAHSNLGNALGDKGQLDEAIAAYQQAIVLNPNLSEAYSNLAAAFKDTAQFDEMIAAFRRALVLNPNLSQAHSNLLFALHYHPGCDPRTIAEEHVRWNVQHAEPRRSFIQPPSTSSGRAHANNRDPHRRLRIGYVSPDFQEHPVGRFILPLLQHHDRRQFEIFCYTNTPKLDGVTQSLRSKAEHWREISGLRDDQIAGRIQTDGIDILVDLAGHTLGNNLLVFAQKPAPIQVTYLGYPDTTGMTAIDYRLSDALADPPGMTEAQTVEKLWRLPACAWVYQPADQMPEIQTRPEGPIVFGCLNNFCKVNPALLQLWAGVLANNAGSRLLLTAPQGDARQSVLKIFADLGVDPTRIELIARLPHRFAYLQTFNRIDVSLDTYPYHGTMTTCESLWMGVPVVTLAGRTHVSRVGVSLLSNAGLGELVAESAEQYVHIATELAHDENRLKQLRSTLRDRMRQSPLMDAKSHALEIENAYRQMWRAWGEAVSPATC